MYASGNGHCTVSIALHIIAEILDSARTVYIAENIFALAEMGLVKHEHQSGKL